MKIFSNYFKEIGVVLSYIIVLILYLFFEWEAYIFFSSIFVEVIALFFMVVLLRFIDQKNNPKRYKNAQPIVNKFIATVPFFLFQFFILIEVSNIGISRFDKNPLLENLTDLLWFGLIILVIYVINAIQIKNNSKRINAFNNSFLYKLIALTVINGLSIYLATEFKVESLYIVLIIGISLRILLEIFLAPKFKSF